MPDIFGYKRSGKPKGVFSSTDAKLTISGMKDVVGSLIQNWNISYAQAINEIFEIGSDEVYWSKGRPQGNGSLSRYVGNGNLLFFSADAYDVCKGGAEITITMAPGKCFGGDASTNKLKIAGAIVIQVGFSVDVGTVIIAEQIGLKFSSLQVE